MKAVTVDDSKLIRQVIKNNLIKLGFKSNEILEASDGKNALEIIMRNKPLDIIITDLDMPGLNGIEFIKKLRKIRYFAETPVVVISGRINNEVVDQLQPLGVMTFVTKPFDQTKFDVVIRPFLKTILQDEMPKVQIEGLRSQFMDDFANNRSKISLRDEIFTIEMEGVTMRIAVDKILEHSVIENDKSEESSED
jgi:CheY-like chemotaxis protein